MKNDQKLWPLLIRYTTSRNSQIPQIRPSAKKSQAVHSVESPALILKFIRTAVLPLLAIFSLTTAPLYAQETDTGFEMTAVTEEASSTPTATATSAPMEAASATPTATATPMGTASSTPTPTATVDPGTCSVDNWNSFISTSIEGTNYDWEGIFASPTQCNTLKPSSPDDGANNCNEYYANRFVPYIYMTFSGHYQCSCVNVIDSVLENMGQVTRSDAIEHCDYLIEFRSPSNQILFRFETSEDNYNGPYGYLNPLEGDHAKTDFGATVCFAKYCNNQGCPEADQNNNLINAMCYQLDRRLNRYYPLAYFQPQPRTSPTPTATQSPNP